LTDEAKDDDVFDPSRVSDGETSGDRHDSSGQASDVAQSGRPLVALFGGDKQEGKVVSTDDSTSDGVEQSDNKANDDGWVGQESQGNQGVTSVESFIEDEGGDQRQSNNEQGDGLG
jgi:hypothetical protein